MGLRNDDEDNHDNDDGTRTGVHEIGSCQLARIIFKHIYQVGQSNQSEDTLPANKH